MIATRLMIAATALSLGLAWSPARADERMIADVACVPAGARLAYDCTLELVRGPGGPPIVEAEVDLAVDMPSMPMAHAVRPVRAVPAGPPGTYRGRLVLEMHGEWAVKVTLVRPFRDHDTVVLRFEGDGVTPR